MYLTGVQAADLNHDGFADLVVEGPGGAAVLVADGTGGFGAPVLLALPFGFAVGAAGTTNGAAIADFNGDGNPDIVFAGSAGHAVAFGSATGTFQRATLYPQLTASYDVRTGDLNGDGIIDFIGMGGAWLGNGDSTFTLGAGAGIPYGAQLADFDRDGFLDMVSIWAQGAPGETAIYYLSVSRGVGNGQFTQYLNWQFRGGIRGLITGDFNQDGNPDVALYDVGAGMLQVVAGNGTIGLGGFIDSVPLPPFAGAMFGADIDGNGSTDIVYSTYRQYSVLRSTHGNPPLLSGLSLTSASVIGGASVSATLTLGGVAPAGGTPIALSSSDPSVSFPAGTSVTIPEGASSTTVEVATTVVDAATSVDLSAAASGVTRTAPLALVPPYTLTGFSVNPASQYGIFSVPGTLTLSGPANSAATIALSSASALASVPATVTVPAGAVSVTFPITLQPVTANTLVGISASLGGITQNASVTVLRQLDTVAISKAQYTLRSVQLKVEATSTSTATTITVYNSLTGAFLGTLANAGGGKYNGTLLVFATGGNITLKSALGGTVTGAYQTK